jgi:hypothetical protein
MNPIRSIADLPFHERPVLDLLHLDVERDGLDLEYTGYGWAHVPRLWLAERGGGAQRVEDVLLLALHSTEAPTPLERDIELEFFVDEVAKDYSVTVLLSDFLARWLPQLREGERAIVLALCNPGRARLSRPAGAPDIPVYYGLGDVDSWREGSELHLVADVWLAAE